MGTQIKPDCMRSAKNQSYSKICTKKEVEQNIVIDTHLASCLRC